MKTDIAAVAPAAVSVLESFTLTLFYQTAKRNGASCLGEGIGPVRFWPMMPSNSLSFDRPDVHRLPLFRHGSGREEGAHLSEILVVRFSSEFGQLAVGPFRGLSADRVRLPVEDWRVFEQPQQAKARRPPRSAGASRAALLRQSERDDIRSGRHGDVLLAIELIRHRRGLP